MVGYGHVSALLAALPGWAFEVFGLNGWRRKSFGGIHSIALGKSG